MKQARRLCIRYSHISFANSMIYKLQKLTTGVSREAMIIAAAMIPRIL
jgi:hypothetical protein